MFALVRPVENLAREQPILGSSAIHARPSRRNLFGPMNLLIQFEMCDLVYTISGRENQACDSLLSIGFPAEFALDIALEILPLLPILLTVELATFP